MHRLLGAQPLKPRPVAVRQEEFRVADMEVGQWRGVGLGPASLARLIEPSAMIFASSFCPRPG